MYDAHSYSTRNGFIQKMATNIDLTLQAPRVTLVDKNFFTAKRQREERLHIDMSTLASFFFSRLIQ